MRYLDLNNFQLFFPKKSWLYKIIYLLILSFLFFFAKELLSCQCAENIARSHKIHLPLVQKSTRLAMVPQYEIKRPKIGLALSGGGLRGIAQIGVLKILEDNQIPIDYIVGTSIGAVVGGLYAAGYNPDDLWLAVCSLNWEKILFDTPKRDLLFLAEKQKRGRALFQIRMSNFKFYLPGSFTPGQTLTETLTDLIFNAPINAFDFSKLRIPLKIVTTDLLSGRKVVISQGNLVEAMRASIAIPLLLSPVDYDSLQLVDGGLLDNIPVDETKNCGADIVIAVNCTAHLRKKGQFQAPWEMVDQVTTIMQQEHNYYQLRKADIILDFQDFSSLATDEQSLKDLFEEGQIRTRKILPKIKELIRQKTETTLPNNNYFITKVVFPEWINISLKNLILEQENRYVSEQEIIKLLSTIYQTGNVKDLFAEIVTDSSKTKLCYHIELQPILREVVFYGNYVLPDSILLSYFQSLLGNNLNHNSSQEALNSIIKCYRSRGYSLAEIKQISFDETLGIARIYISEGIIDNICFIGNRSTREYVLKREFQIKAGDTFQLPVVKAGIANLFGTGLFDAVNFEVRPSGDQWNIYIKLQEKKYTVLRMGIRYDEERYGKTFIELGNENILGTANDATLHTLFGSREKNFLLQLNTNRISKSYLTGNIKLYYQAAKYYYYEDYINKGEYQRQSMGISLGMGMQIARLGTLSAIMRIERIKTNNITSLAIMPMNFPVQTLGINSTVDTRDQVPYPFSGKFHKFSYEISSGKLLGAKLSYFKVQSFISSYWTIFRRNTLSPRLMWGTSDLGTPFSEQYHIGGEESFFGLRDGALVGRNILIASMEYRYWIPWNRFFDFFISLRFDFGSVWKNYIKVQTEDFISGKGISLALKTPFGPISLSYGIASLNQKCFYFSAGYHF